MFNFLNTAILTAAVVALLPFILHLFSRRKVKVVPFSSIAYLKAMQKRQVRAIKIKQLLLLIIRTLIILAIVMAFARPATQGGYWGSHGGVSAIIIIDNSASMGASAKDGLVFSLAVKRAHGVIDMLGEADEVAVIATNGLYATPSGNDVFGNPDAASGIVDNIRLTDSRADLIASYGTAAKLIANRPNVNREIYIISDFQKSSLPSDTPIDSTDENLFLVDVTDAEFVNNGITHVDLGNQLIEVGTEFPITATVKSYASNGNDDILLSLFLDNNRVSQDGIRLKAGESGQVQFALTVDNPGFHSGYVELSDDDLSADNRFYFSFFIPDNFSILLVGKDRLDTRIVKLALAPNENLRRHWSVTMIPYKDLPSVTLRDYGVVFLVNYTSISNGDLARLKEYVKKGGGLFVNVGQLSDTGAFNQQMSEMTGLRLMSSFPKHFSRSGFYLLSDFNLDHPLLSVFKDSRNNSPLSFKSYAIVKTALIDTGTVDVLARFSDGSPAITTNTYGRGRVMYVGCDMTPDISDISLHPFFVPFIVRSGEFLSSGFTAPDDNLFSGSFPRRKLRKSFSVTNEYTLIAPDNVRRIVSADQKDNIKTVVCGQLDKAGIYRIMNGNVESDCFAVNIVPGEGDLYRDDWNALEKRFGGRHLPSTANLAGFLSEQRYGRELWHYFLIVALLLMIAEMVIARDRGAPLSKE